MGEHRQRDPDGSSALRPLGVCFLETILNLDLEHTPDARFRQALAERRQMEESLQRPHSLLQTRAYPEPSPLLGSARAGFYDLSRGASEADVVSRVRDDIALVQSLAAQVADWDDLPRDESAPSPSRPAASWRIEDSRHYSMTRDQARRLRELLAAAHPPPPYFQWVDMTGDPEVADWETKQFANVVFVGVIPPLWDIAAGPEAAYFLARLMVSDSDSLKRCPGPKRPSRSDLGPCGRLFVVSRRGNPRETCSGKCRVYLHRLRKRERQAAAAGRRTAS